MQDNNLCEGNVKVILLNKSELLIEPETDFEETWLQNMGKEEERDLVAFHKTGMSTGDYQGLKVKVKDK